MFQDITTLLLDPKAFKDTIDLFVERYKGKNISVVAGKKKKKNPFFLFGEKDLVVVGLAFLLIKSFLGRTFYLTVISLKVVGSFAYDKVGLGDAESAFSFLLLFSVA